MKAPGDKRQATRIQGRVIRGDGYGRTIGFPTANLDRRDYVRRKLNLKFGVYAGTATLPSGKSYRAGIVIGPRDLRGLPKIEAHLIGFAGNLYGKRLVLEVGRFLRPFRKFKDVEVLKKQIKRDIKKISNYSN